MCDVIKKTFTAKLLINICIRVFVPSLFYKKKQI